MEILRNRRFWVRAAALASLGWVGLMVIAAQVMRDFRWFPNAYIHNYDFGPAGITAMVGVGLIWLAGLGVPWVADSAASRS